MEYLTIKDLCSIKTGKLDANASVENGKYPFYTCADVPLRIDTPLEDCECLLIVGNGANTGKVFHNFGPYNAYQRTYIIKIKMNYLYDYLFWLFKAKTSFLLASSIGAATNYIKLSNIENIVVPKIDISKQQEIVLILNKINAIIDADKKQLELLDETVKSRFIEMFGEPFGNQKYPIKELKDISESLIDGSNIPPTHYEKTGDVLFLRIQNVWRNEFRLDDSVYVSKKINEEFYDTSLKKGDLLMTKIGRYYTKDSSLGRVSLYNGDDDRANYSNNIMRIRLKNMNSYYVNILLNLPEYDEFIRRTSKGGTDKRALSKSLIGSYPIIVPPIELQNEFASFVELIDKSKFNIQQHLNLMQELLDKKMEEFFGGKCY